MLDTGSLSSWEGQQFSLLEYILDMDLSSLSLVFVKTPSVNLWNALFPHHGIPHNTACDQETHFMDN